MCERLRRAIAESPADETEIVWLDARLGHAEGRGSSVETRRCGENTVLVRVLDRGRVGSYRGGGCEVADLATGIRQAIAQSRVREPLSGLPHLPADATGLTIPAGIDDPAVRKLSTRGVKALLKDLPRRGEAVRLDWSDARVAVFNSRGIRRRIEVTAVGFSARCGRRPGSGEAADAARRLDALDLGAVLERARQRHARGDVGELPAGSLSVVLSPRATIDLVDLLHRVAFSAKAYYDGSSFLREHLGVQVFDRALSLRDDGTDPSGLPFPFDLEGTAKHTVDLISKGAPKTPALDQRQAAVLGLPPTAHAIGGNNARAENLFLVPGEQSATDLLCAADGGVWIGGLAHVECYEPLRVGFRARARGTRLIQGGQLGAPLPDLVWDDSLLRALSNLLGIGDTATNSLSPDGYLGGISAPALAIGGVDELRAARPSRR